MSDSGCSLSHQRSAAEPVRIVLHLEGCIERRDGDAAHYREHDVHHNDAIPDQADFANMSFPPLCHQQPVAPDQADIARSSSAQAGGRDARLASLRARSAWSAACAASSAAAAASSNTAMA